MIDFVADALATHRLTQLITSDKIADRPRAHVMQALHVAEWHQAKELLRCDWCVSIWVAFGVVAARRLAPRAWSPVARALACSTVAGTVSAFTYGGDG